VPSVDAGRLPSRVEAGVENVLRLLDDAGGRATFFVLGEVARAHPRLVSLISSRGHEIGCHGMTHSLVYRQSPEVFREELRRAAGLLREQSGAPVVGFRAPSWSITRESLWALEALSAEGFVYDSSVFPADARLYGIAGAPRGPYRVGSLIELPPPIFSAGPIRVGAGGGFYLRALPEFVLRAALGEYERRGWPFIVHAHPRELDPGAWEHRLPFGPVELFVQHYGLSRSPERLAALLAKRKSATLWEILKARGAV
jgi:polysaccharide deacetylase family protein (PEP-CTERM system associated)